MKVLLLIAAVLLTACERDPESFVIRCELDGHETYRTGPASGFLVGVDGGAVYNEVDHTVRRMQEREVCTKEPSP